MDGSTQGRQEEHQVVPATGPAATGRYIQLHSLQGLIRGENPELGADADTGGQVTAQVESSKSKRLIVCDLDEVLTGDLEATGRLTHMLEARRDEVWFAITTGRSAGSVRRLLAAGALPEPDWLVAAAGSEIYRMPGFRPIAEWEARLRGAWDRGRVQAVLDRFTELLAQEATAQSRYNLSYFVAADVPKALVET